MKYILNYKEQYTEDFIYMFPDLDIVCVIAKQDKLNGTFEGWDYLKSVNWQDTRLLLCDSKQNKNKYDNLLNTYGCDQYTEWADDYLLQLNEKYVREISGGKPILLWGCGNTYKDFISKHPEIKNVLLVDSKPSSSEILRPDEVDEWSKYFVIITSVYYEEIAKELDSKAVKRKDYISCFEMWESPREMFLNMQDAPTYKNVICYDPFTIRNIDEDGRLIYCICPTWIKATGNILNKSYVEIENSIYSKLIKLSVINQTYYFCCKDAGKCVLFDRNLYPDYDKNIPESGRLREPKSNRKCMLLRTDQSCNLKCESCRDRYITEPVDTKKAEAIKNIIQNQILQECNEAIIASNGDFFFSRHYREIVSSRGFGDNIKTLFIMTNGLLFNEANWEWLRNVYKNDIQVSVSIDAASDEAYKKIRGGDYQKLLRSLSFISKLRQSGEVSFFEINFVVQRSNYKDMPEFVRLGTELNVDSIYFGHLTNWGTYTDAGFEKITMFDMDDPRKPNKELQRMISSCQNMSERINWDNLWKNFRIRH